MSEVRKIVATRFGQIHVRVSAEGGVPLVLLHMSPRSSQMWMRLQAALPRQTIAPDRLGYGFSDPPARQLTMLEYTQSTLDALDALNIGPRFDVLGMHTGSLEAIELAHLAGARVRRIGIIAIPVFDAQRRARGIETFASLRVIPKEDGSHLLPAWKARFQFREPPFDVADVQRRYVDYLLAPYPGQAYNAVFAYDAEPRLRAVRQPLIAFAPRDDVYDLTVQSRDMLPVGSRYVDLPDYDVDFLRTHTAPFAAMLETLFPND